MAYDQNPKILLIAYYLPVEEKVHHKDFQLQKDHQLNQKFQHYRLLNHHSYKNMLEHLMQ